MRMIKGMLAVVLAMVLAACGGGGCDAGSSPLTGAAACSASTAASGSAGTTPTTGGSTAGGGISNVSSGQPNQRSMSISVEKYALNWSIDGDQTTVTIRVADTAGNPVPEGTAVQFSSSGGQIQTSCRLTGVASGASAISQCNVTFATQNQRPLNGFVAISAWLEGDEAYIDRNGDGKYNPGEPFYDTGRLFRDDDINGAYTANVDELNLGSTVISSPGLGTSTCGPNAGTSGLVVTDATFGFRDISVPSSVTSTCDGAWGRTLVRASTYLPVSDPRFLAIAQASGGVLVSSQWSSDPLNASAAPAGTTVSVVSAPAGCTFNISPPTVPNNSIGPTFHRLTPSVSGTCAAGQVTVKAASGANEVTVTANLPL